MASEHILEPWDEYNKKTASSVHPAGWENPEPADRYNLVVIGAGTAGLVSAAGAAGLGARVALVEKHLLGGDCLNVGCVPSKALIRAGRAAADVRDAAEFGVDVPAGTRVDFSRVMERMRRLRARISPNDSAARFRDLGVDVFIGEGRFLDGSTVDVGGNKLRFKNAVIATGARAVLPPVPGLAEAGCLTNETLFSLTELPQRLAVLGGGPIGCEMAQSFARFGAKVSLIEAGPHVLMREDEDAARIVENSLLKDGVELLTGCELKQVRPGGGKKVLRVVRGDIPGELSVDAVLVGVGRAPNVEGIGLEDAGVRFDPREGVEVDDALRTSAPGIFAAGDVCSVYKFTHTADALARIVIQNALFPGPDKKVSALTVPWCTYTDPELAHVGLHPSEAARRGMRVRSFSQPFADVDRAVLEGEAGGLLKVHVQEGSDRIVGATLVGRHAGDMISELTLAMTAGVGLGRLAQTIHPYPTVAEVIKKTADAYNRTRLTPMVKALLSRWLAWTR